MYAQLVFCWGGVGDPYGVAKMKTFDPSLEVATATGPYSDAGIDSNAQLVPVFVETYT